jgi:hypothetical protein
MYQLIIQMWSNKKKKNVLFAMSKLCIYLFLVILENWNGQTLNGMLSAIRY